MYFAPTVGAIGDLNDKPGEWSEDKKADPGVDFWCLLKLQIGLSKSSFQAFRDNCMDWHKRDPWISRDGDDRLIDSSQAGTKEIVRRYKTRQR